MKKEVLALSLLLSMTACASPSASAAQSLSSDSTAETEEEAVKGIQFPYEAAEGKLLVESVFTSDTANPDAGNQFGSEIVTVQISNVSDQYLDSAGIIVHLSDGTLVPFEITNLPAGKCVLAFASDSTSVKDTACEEIELEASFSDSVSFADTVAVNVDGLSIEVMNITDETLYNVDLYCHCAFDEETYFGGITYIYTIEGIEPGDSAYVEALDCLVGEPEIVKIETE